MKPKVSIEYCPKCGWLLRASWMCQELLTTFSESLGEVSLMPSETNGCFDIMLDGKLIFSRKEQGRFPEAKELKQLVRDVIDPERDLGHLDKR